MEKVILKSQQEKWELDDLEWKFIFPYIYRFVNRFNISMEGRSFIIKDNLLLEFRNYLSEALNNIIVDCYSDPSVHARQKHPTYYQKFVFLDKKYVVNYTTSTIGRLMYTMYLRLDMVEKAIKREEHIMLTGFKDEKVWW